MTTVKCEVLEVLRNLPGISSGQICELLPHVKQQTVYAQLNQLYVRRLIDRQKSEEKDALGKRPYLWSINESASFAAKVATKKAKPKRTAGEVVEAAWETMRNRLDELEAWKANAIQRYPDLAVSELVLRARQIVADEAEPAARPDIHAGKRDASLPMRVVIKMLEGGVS